MQPYEGLGFFSFIASILHRLFLFLTFQLNLSECVSEDMQFLALIFSGLIGLFLGFYLIYSKMTMVANSLSHTVLLGIVLAFVLFKTFYGMESTDKLPFSVLMAASLLSSILTVLLIRYLSKRVGVEASNAFSFTAFFALGILLSSVLIKNAHLGLESVLGDLEVISSTDVARLFWTLIGVVAFCLLMQSRLRLICFDRLFAQTLGCAVNRIEGLLILLSAICLAVCFRALGVILILSLLTAPVLIARLFFHKAGSIFLFGAIWIFFQALFCMATVQWLYYSLDLPVSTSGLYGFIGLLSYLVAYSSRSFLRKKIC